MPVFHQPTHDQTPEVWRPAGALTIEHAASAWHDVQPLLAQPVLHVDLSAVDRLDTAGCQLLVQTQREVRRRGGRCAISAGSAPVADVIAMLGCVALGDREEER